MSGSPQGTLGSLLRERARIDAELRRHQADVAILFTDVVGSTAYYDRFGNTAGVLLMQRHDDVTNRALAEFQGRWIKSTGDGSMAEFDDPVMAVRASIVMQRQLFEKNQQLPEANRIQLRIGINYGEVIRKDNDVWGNAVNVAARVCAKCEPAQVLVSASVQAKVPAEAGIAVNSLGMFALKGKQQQEELFEVMWTEKAAYQKLRHDVTRMVATGHLKKKDLMPVETEMPVIGGRFAGRYEILEELGVGGMGVVYKAHDEETGEMLALKVLRSEIAADHSAMERFKNELRVARRITHPKVCRVHDFGRASGTAYISMEYVDGRNLRDMLDQHVPNLNVSMNIALDLSEALGEVHRQGAVHRDLKPTNVMVTAAHDLKLMDFGISGFGNTGLTATGVAMGTPQYMAPEQVSEKPVDARTDVYSFGLTFYEVLTGDPAFQGDSTLAVAMKQLHENPPPPRQLRPAIPAEVEQVVLKCLQKDPERRYHSATELRADLQRVAALPSVVAVTSAVTSAEPAPQREPQPGEVRVNPKDGLSYVWIPPGTFERGASASDHEAAQGESPKHRVTLTRGFWMGQTPVTIAAYKRFVEDTSAAMPADIPAKWSAQCPMVNVNWGEAATYCAWADGRLPTDAEWEYAARANYAGPRYGDPAQIAWFRVTPPGARPVRGKEPNAWGLYDVLGNVWEWCADWFEEYQVESQTNPRGPFEGDFLILRGGSWDDHPRMARLSVRSWRSPDYRSTTCGFRCVLDYLEGQ